MRRRAFAIFAIAALIIVPSVLLFLNQTGGDDGADVKIPATPHSTKDSKLGIAVSWPDGWKLSRKGGVIKLISKDRSSAVVVSSPAVAKEAVGVLGSAVSGVSAGYKKRHVQFLRGQRLAGLRSVTALITGKTKKGVSQNVILTVARGRKRTYVFESIVPARGGRQGDIALISRSLRLTG